MKVVSFFSGCGGLDLGFEQAGFDVIWANDNDKAVHETYMLNHPNTHLCKNDMRCLSVHDIPECDGFIGGPPCQSWSEGGKQRGLADERGKLFLTYIHFIKAKQPKFFVIENVKGILSDKHFQTFMLMLDELKSAGYIVHYSLMNTMYYRIPQERYRVIVVGVRNDFNIDYHFPAPDEKRIITLKEAIGDIPDAPTGYTDEKVNQEYQTRWNHDVYMGAFDNKFMARNRVRGWNEVSFTIQAQARNCPLHPQAPKMLYICRDKQIFVPGKEYLYRRLSVRECARIQTFPDRFKFVYQNVCDGYKMVGNAVPPRLGKAIALSIKAAFSQRKKRSVSILVATFRDDYQLQITKEHKIYYVRAGLRKGAMQFASGMKMPEYLLLHKGEKRLIFNLKKQEPLLVSKERLQDYGFVPSGDLYWLFTIENMEDIKCPIDISRISIPKGNAGFIPFVIEQEL